MIKIILGTVMLVIVITGLILAFKQPVERSTQNPTINAVTSTQKISSPLPSKNNHLFEYLERADISKFKVLGKVVDAWKVNINTGLLTDENNKTIILNLMDGINYEIVRGDAYVKNSYDKINCNDRKCGWRGYYNDGNVSKNLETGETRPANWLNIQIEETAILASFSPMADAYKHINYLLQGEENNYYLLKIDTSEVRMED